MEINKPSRGEFGIVARKCFIEAALVVVVPVIGGIVFTANIHNDVAGFEESRISSADESAGIERRELAEEIHGKSLIGVEVAAAKRRVSFLYET